jgi:putative flippase GtrA
VGFLLNKYVVFIGSQLRGRIQLFRYFLSFSFNLVVNYMMLKLLVEIWGLDPLPAQCITITIIIAISYLTQKHFSFRVKKEI